MKLIFAGLLVIALFGCHAPNRAVKLIPVRPPSTNLEKVASSEEQMKAPVISEITIRRNPGMTTEPTAAYKLTLRADGKVTYVGGGLNSRKGRYHITILPSVFAQLAQFMEESKFDKMEWCYGQAATDIATVEVSIVRGGKTKEVIDYGDRIQSDFKKKAYKALQEIQQRIDATVANVAWVKDSATTQ